MLFRRTILSALFIGLIAGLVLSAAQIITVNPIIFEAETYELAVPHQHSGHSHSHEHQVESWAPKDGAERTGYTVFANVAAGIGFASIILALMSQLHIHDSRPLTVFKGLLWGGAGYAVFFLAPSIGIPPEIPGIEAPPLAERQFWWFSSALCTGAGLLTLFFAAPKCKVIGGAIILIPYIIGVPAHDGALFSHPDPLAVMALTHLHQEFIVASGLSNLLFWITLGALSSCLLNVWVFRAQDQEEATSDPLDA